MTRSKIIRGDLEGRLGARNSKVKFMWVVGRWVDSRDVKFIGGAFSKGGKAAP